VVNIFHNMTGVKYRYENVLVFAINERFDPIFFTIKVLSFPDITVRRLKCLENYYFMKQFNYV
jgi:hypothetical protein